MRAIDVMTSEVITVGENATVPEAAKLLAEHGISAVPVVDKHNRVIGMVSEGDLLHRAETGTERRRSWWLEMVSSTDKLAGEYIKSHSGKVKDIMTRDVLSVTEETPVADIAVLLEINRIKRVPVLRDRKTITDYLDTALRTAIYDGQFADNEELNQVQLSEFFGVSRVPIIRGTLGP